jgi:hypothetical protein
VLGVSIFALFSCFFYYHRFFPFFFFSFYQIEYVCLHEIQICVNV